MIARAAIVAFAIAGAAAAAPTPSPSTAPSMTTASYPSTHARLRLTQRSGDDPPRVFELEVWLRGSRFHVRELAGRRLDELLADLRDPRQLGALPRTLEEIMDRDSSDRARAGRPRAPTELYGDLATDAGWERGARPRELRAGLLAPIAEQILARGKSVGLQRGAETTRLGRAATEYRGVVVVHADGKTYDNDVVRVIAGPVLLYEETRHGKLSYTRELLALDDGPVADADVTAP